MMKLVFFCIIAYVFAETESLQTNFQVDGRIVGGGSSSNNSIIDKYPYHVSIQNAGNHVCSGSIISPYFVLTAAHCLIYSASGLTVRAGSSTSNTGGTVYPVSSGIRHPSFNTMTMEYDYALIKINGNFKIGNHQEVVELPEQGDVVVPGSTGVLTGWGASNGGSTSSVLRGMNMVLVSQEECKQCYGSTGNTCATEQDGNTDECPGDTGGGFVVGNKLLGLHNTRYGCTPLPSCPAMFSSVASIRAWIRNNAGV